MEKNELLVKYRHFSVLGLYALAGIFFGFCEKFLVPRYIIHSRLDNYIPFVKEAIIPYLFWYVYITVPLLYFGFTSKIDFYRLVAFIVGGMSVAVIIYILFPNEQNLRPVITQTDVFSRIIKAIYKADTPTDVMPSIHVLNSIAVHAVIVNSDLFKNRKLIKFASFICMVSISASTVLVKQHSIIDVFGGIVIGIAIYLVIYKVPVTLFKRKYVESH